MSMAGSSGNIIDEAEAFARRASNRFSDLSRKFDVIHAHDWLTFGAATILSGKLGVGWIAHFHSTERDRQGSRASGLIEEIGAIGVRKCKPCRRTERGLQNQLPAVADGFNQRSSHRRSELSFG